MTINFRTRPDGRFFHTLGHETVHLFIQSYVNKHGLDHWEKERLVDTICHLPEFVFLARPWQNDYHRREEHVDAAFKTHYAVGLDKVAEEIVKTRPKHVQDDFQKG